MTIKSSQNNYFMNIALKEAVLAYHENEIPIGAVIVVDGKIISKAHNKKESFQDPTAHAEIIVIKEASKILKSWRLKGATLYVTIEPCLMCLGAIIHSRIDTLVFASKEPKMGAVYSLYKGLLDVKGVHHKPKLLYGVKEKTASWLLTRFFRKIRRKQNL